jgi:DNA repair photolyase
VHVQVGLTATNDGIRRLLEPHAASVGERLQTLKTLVANGVGAEARMDPLIPELTDTRESFLSLCDAIQQCGARQVAASYLFLRKATYGRLDVAFGDWSFYEMAARLYTDRVEGYCGGQAIRTPALDYRRTKYNELRSIAARAGIQLRLCRCKNPDLTDECCHPKPATARRRSRQLTLLGH